MSYDFDVTRAPSPFFDDVHPAFATDGMAGNATLDGARIGNYTSNVSNIWARCLTAALDEVPAAQDFIGRDRVGAVTSAGIEPPQTLVLRDLAGLSARDASPVLAAAVRWGAEHIDELREMDPANGWGCAEGAVTYLWDIQRHCEAHPDGTLEIDS